MPEGISAYSWIAIDNTDQKILYGKNFNKKREVYSIYYNINA